MVVIRELTTLAEMEEVQVIEHKVWGIPPIPTHQTLTAVKNGGIMIGAYDGDKMVGFSYGFPGFKDGKIYLCSHMLGIDAAYRSQGIGERLKWKQREIAIAKGYDRMHWTYDPLETRNGYLNLTKLNGICDTYIENCYGEMNDEFNKGLPSDRFEVHWYLKSPHVVEKHEPDISNPVPASTLTFNADGLPEFVPGTEETLTAPVYTVSVPKFFQELKAANFELARDWRMQTRVQFQRLFRAGYAAVRVKAYERHVDYFFVKKETLQLGGNA